MTKLNVLVADHKNARKRTQRSATLIETSLREFGAARSIVIDEHNRVLAGNGTVEGAKAIGLENVKVIETDGNEIIAVKRKNLTEDEKVGLALADNRTGDLAEWDAEMLENLSFDHSLDPWFEEGDLEQLIGATADEVDFPEISDADKSDLEQITLTMHTTQAETFKEAMQLAKKMGEFDQTLNENSNGNAATRVAESFLSWASDHGVS